MKTTTRKIISFFLLLLFVLPLANKTVHDFGHRDDFHCAEKSVKHIHELEHNCSLCDYQSPVSVSHTFSSDQFVLNPESVLLVIPAITIHDAPSFYRLSSRGPPALV